jgi:16S rRNA processing protein RimM
VVGSERVIVSGTETKRILLGQINGAHGIRGEVLVRTFTGDPGAISDYGPLTDASGNAPLKLKVLRVTPKGVVARITGVADRNGAEALKGRKLYVLRAAMPEPEEDAFYHEDLIGLAAVDEAGTPIGKVLAVQNFGAGDLLEIKLATGGATELIPFTRACVPKVEIAARRVVVVMPVVAEEDAEDKAARLAAERESGLMGDETGGDE